MNTPDNLYYDYPLTTLIINGHEPQWVDDILNRVDKELDEDARVLLMKWMVDIARVEMARN